MNWDYPKPFTYEYKVLESDIDGMGHANNANYVIWCEEVAWLHSANLGLTVEDYQRLDRGVAIRKGIYEYISPSFAGEELLIGTWLTDCDRTLRLQRRFQIFNKTSGEMRLRGEWQLACVALSSGKPCRFPEEFIRSYADNVIDITRLA